MNTEQTTCSVCGRPFLRRTKKSKGKGIRSMGFRKVGAKTCSKKCAGEFYHSRYFRLKKRNI